MSCLVDVMALLRRRAPWRKYGPGCLRISWNRGRRQGPVAGVVAAPLCSAGKRWSSATSAIHAASFSMGNCSILVRNGHSSCAEIIRHHSPALELRAVPSIARLEHGTDDGCGLNVRCIPISAHRRSVVNSWKAPHRKATVVPVARIKAEIGSVWIGLRCVESGCDAQRGELLCFYRVRRKQVRFECSPNNAESILPSRSIQGHVRANHTLNKKWHTSPSRMT